MTSPCSFPLCGLPQFPSFTLLLPPHFLPFLCFIFLTELSFSNLPCPSSSPLLALLLSLALLWPSLCFHFSPFICFHVLIPLTKYDSGKGNAKKKSTCGELLVGNIYDAKTWGNPDQDSKMTENPDCLIYGLGWFLWDLIRN